MVFKHTHIYIALTPQAAEGLIDEAEQPNIAGVLSLIPQGVAAASEGSMVADLAQAFVDAMAGADEDRAAAVQQLVRQQVKKEYAV